MNIAHYIPEQQPRALLPTSISVSNKDSGKQIHLPLFLDFRSGVIKVSVLLRIFAASLDNRCPKLADSVVVSSSIIQMYEGWNFNFGNSPLDWIQELLE